MFSMSRFASLLAGITLVSAANGTELLAQMTYFPGSHETWSSYQSEAGFSAIRFFLRHHGDPAHGVPALELGREYAIYWHGDQNDPAYFDFADSAFFARITDGNNHTIGSAGEFAPYGDHRGAGTEKCWSESELFQTATDLTGCTLEYVRLKVRGLGFSNNGAHQILYATVIWEFYGARRGACCVGSACSTVTQPQCAALGGTWNPNSSCSAQGLCTVTCCMPDGTCYSEYTAEECAAQGGNVLGSDKTCGDCPRACCLSSGCVMISSQECLAQEGFSLGPGHDCGEGLCVPPFVHLLTAKICPSFHRIERDVAGHECGQQYESWALNANDCPFTASSMYHTKTNVVDGTPVVVQWTDALGRARQTSLLSSRAPLWISYNSPTLSFTAYFKTWYCPLKAWSFCTCENDLDVYTGCYGLQTAKVARCPYEFAEASSVSGVARAFLSPPNCSLGTAGEMQYGPYIHPARLADTHCVGSIVLQGTIWGVSLTPEQLANLNADALWGLMTDGQHPFNASYSAGIVRTVGSGETWDVCRPPGTRTYVHTLRTPGGTLVVGLNGLEDAYEAAEGHVYVPGIGTCAGGHGYDDRVFSNPMGTSFTFGN